MSSDQTTFSAVLGVVLANLRKVKGIEQGEMARKMGVSQASYSRLESGKSSFSVDQLYLAAQALEIDGAELTQRLNNAVKQLNVNGVPVIAPLRANATKAGESGVDPGSMLMGAGLAAFSGHKRFIDVLTVLSNSLLHMSDAQFMHGAPLDSGEQLVRGNLLVCSSGSH